MLESFRAVVFDLDGIIIDSEPLHEQATRNVFDRYGLAVPARVFGDFKGQTDRDIFTHVVQTYGEETLDVAVLLAAKQEAYHEQLHVLQPIPGALAFIERLVAQGMTLGLVTSATPQNQRFAFERFGLEAHFAAIVTASDVTQAKPHPEPYQTIATRLQMAPADCLVIEDSTNGIASARAAGCTVVGLTTSFPAAELEAAGARLVATSFEELARQLTL